MYAVLQRLYSTKQRKRTIRQASLVLVGRTQGPRLAICPALLFARGLFVDAGRRKQIQTYHKRVYARRRDARRRRVRPRTRGTVLSRRVPARTHAMQTLRCLRKIRRKRSSFCRCPLPAVSRARRVVTGTLSQVETTEGPYSHRTRYLLLYRALP